MRRRFWRWAALRPVFLCLLLAVFQGAARAQVANDNIENRRVLKAGETVASSTTGCTVQRSCVDQTLTGQCIIYHNDQWFEFTPAVAGRYFVNIGGQRCRDVRGVQLVVLTGQPCEPATYHVLNCTSLGDQGNVFVALDGLKAGQPYLLDVDGYLKDFCQFTLQVSTRAQGVPAVVLPSLARALPNEGRVVRLAWALPDSLGAVPGCRVLRREQHEFRAAERLRVPVLRNTYGGQPANFAATDTLPHPGYYLYQIVADATPGAPGGPAILKQFWVAYGQKNPLLGRPAAPPHLSLPLRQYPRKAEMSVLVMDAASGRILLNKQFVNQLKDPEMGWVSTELWQDAGIRKVAVDITCHLPHGRFFTDHLLFDVPAPAATP